MNDHEKAVKITDNIGKPKKKPTRIKIAIGTGVIAIILIITLFISFYITWTQGHEEKKNIIDEIESLNATIDNARIVYGARLKYFENNWTQLEVRIIYPDTPWDNYLGYFWYNTETREYKITERG